MSEREVHGTGTDCPKCADVMALKAQVERQLVQACAIGMSTILVRCGAYGTLSPYLREQYDTLAKLHSGAGGEVNVASKSQAYDAAKALATAVRSNVPILKPALLDALQRVDALDSVSLSGKD